MEYVVLVKHLYKDDIDHEYHILVKHLTRRITTRMHHMELEYIIWELTCWISNEANTCEFKMGIHSCNTSGIGFSLVCGGLAASFMIRIPYI